MLSFPKETSLFNLIYYTYFRPAYFPNVVDYADDKAIISIDKNPITTSANLQTHLNPMSSGTQSSVFNGLI